jgi:hypothetical protein
MFFSLAGLFVRRLPIADSSFVLWFIHMLLKPDRIHTTVVSSTIAIRARRTPTSFRNPLSFLRDTAVYAPNSTMAMTLEIRKTCRDRCITRSTLPWIRSCAPWINLDLAQVSHRFSPQLLEALHQVVREIAVASEQRGESLAARGAVEYAVDAEGEVEERVPATCA